MKIFQIAKVAIFTFDKNKAPQPIFFLSPSAAVPAPESYTFGHHLE
jgi:hypothetical protein